MTFDESRRRIGFHGPFAEVRAGADRHIERLAVRREGKVARPVMANRKFRDDRLRFARGLQIAGLVGETERRCRCSRHRRIPDRRSADKMRCRRAGRGRRRKRPAPRRSHPRPCGSTLISPASLSATNTSPFGAIADHARLSKAAGELRHREAVRHLRLGTRRPVGQPGRVARRLRVERQRQIGRLDQPRDARPRLLPVAKRLGAGQNIGGDTAGLRHRPGKRNGDRSGREQRRLLHPEL